LVLIIFLAGCAGNTEPLASTERPTEVPPPAAPAEELPPPAAETPAPEEPDTRCYCEYEGRDMSAYLHTPPIHIQVYDADDFPGGFNAVHHYTHLEWDSGGFYNRLVFTTEETVFDFAFITIWHTWFLGSMDLYERERQFTVDEFTPDDVFVLDAAFFHYLLPRGGLAFTVGDGTRRYMAIQENMAGGCCIPIFNIYFFTDRTQGARVNSIDPTPVQRAEIARMLGEFTLGEVGTYTAQQDDTQEFLFRPVQYTPSALVISADAYETELTFSMPTQVGDALLVYAEGLDLLRLVIHTRDVTDTWGTRRYYVVLHL
jgi:hypothetical protein